MATFQPEPDIGARRRLRSSVSTASPSCVPDGMSVSPPHSPSQPSSLASADRRRLADAGRAGEDGHRGGERLNERLQDLDYSVLAANVGHLSSLFSLLSQGSSGADNRSSTAAEDKWRNKREKRNKGVAFRTFLRFFRLFAGPAENSSHRIDVGACPTSTAAVPGIPPKRTAGMIGIQTGRRQPGTSRPPDGCTSRGNVCPSMGRNSSGPGWHTVSPQVKCRDAICRSPTWNPPWPCRRRCTRCRRRVQVARHLPRSDRPPR